jgi:hypothetical protein
MADQKISDLAAVTDVQDTDVYPLARSGATKKITGANLKAGAAAGSQPLDATLTAFAALVIAAGKLPYGSGSDAFSLADLTAAGRALLDDADASAQLTTLGLSAFVKTLMDDADASTFLTTLGVSTFIKTLLDDANAAAARTTLDVPATTDLLAPDGTTLEQSGSTIRIKALGITDAQVAAANKDGVAGTASMRTLGTGSAQAAAGNDSRFATPTDAELAAIAGLTSAADKLPYFTGSGTASLADLTAAGRALLDDAAASNQRTTLGLAIGTDVPAQATFDDHSARHESGGADAIKIDDLAAGDDNTDLNVSTTKHGLTPKLSNVATEYLSGTGVFSTPSGSGIPSTIVDAKGDLIAATAADTVARLAVGSNGQVLTADSGESTGIKWAAAPGGGVVADTIWDAKGDLAVASAADTAARLAVGSNAQVLTADSTQTLGVKWGTPTDFGQWLVQILPYLSRTVVQGTWKFDDAADTPSLFGFFTYNSSSAQNDEIMFPVVLSAGTWQIEIICLASNNCGIATVSLGGSSVGTMDTYSASTTRNVVKSITGISVATSGQTTLSFKIATKNASSSNYRFNPQLISLLRTA